MAADDTVSDLVIRAKGHTITPSRDDTLRIRDAVGIVTEIFESLIQVAADDRTASALLSAGNGEAHGPTPGDLEEIAQRLHETLAALLVYELDVDGLEASASVLDQHAASMRQSFEARSEQFTPRPVEEAEALSVTGALFAGLSDAAGALDQLAGLLEEVVHQSREGHGRDTG
jgi:hypothetical protein